MGVPEHLWRFPTAAAIASLVERFGFAYDQTMQDWEWQVADESRIVEFLDAYKSGELSDDERFTLMETILQSSEDAAGRLRNHDAVPLDEQVTWPDIVQLLRRHINLHAYTIYYWSCVDDETDDEIWKVTPYVRQIMDETPEAFAA